MTRHWGRFPADRGDPLDVGAPEPMPVRLSLQPPADLVCARWSLAVCVVCGHDETDGTGRVRITCPDCGSTAWRTRLGPVLGSVSPAAK